MARKDAKTGAKEELATRRASVWEDRKAGMTVRVIARRLSVPRSTVHDDIKAVMKEVNRAAFDDAKQLQALQWERLDMALLALYPRMIKGDTSAVAQWVSVIKAQCELKGLNEPKKIAPTLDGAPLEVPSLTVVIRNDADGEYSP